MISCEMYPDDCKGCIHSKAAFDGTGTKYYVCLLSGNELAVTQQQWPEGQGEDIASLLHADIEARASLGEKKYGERLKAFNGRDPLVDAYQEALDLVFYLRQELIEREKRKIFKTF